MALRLQEGSRPHRRLAARCIRATAPCCKPTSTPADRSSTEVPYDAKTGETDLAAFARRWTRIRRWCIAAEPELLRGGRAGTQARRGCPRPRGAAVHGHHRSAVVRPSGLAGQPGADLAVGELQSFGNSMTFGGPGVGFFAGQARSSSGSSPAAWRARPSTSTASGPSCSRSLPASSTSGARTRPPTSAPTTACARWPPRCTWRSWARRGFGSWRCSTTDGPSYAREKLGKRALHRPDLQRVRGRSGNELGPGAA